MFASPREFAVELGDQRERRRQPQLSAVGNERRVVRCPRTKNGEIGARQCLEYCVQRGCAGEVMRPGRASEEIDLCRARTTAEVRHSVGPEPNFGPHVRRLGGIVVQTETSAADVVLAIGRSVEDLRLYSRIGNDSDGRLKDREWDRHRERQAVAAFDAATIALGTEIGR